MPGDATGERREDLPPPPRARRRLPALSALGPTDLLAGIGAALALAGAAASYGCMPDSPCSRSLMLGSSATAILGVQLLLLGVFARCHAAYVGGWGRRRAEAGPPAGGLRNRGLLVGATALAGGLALAGVAAVTTWAPTSAAGLGQTRVLGVVAVFVVTELLFSALLLGGGALARKIAAKGRGRSRAEALRAAWAWLRTPSGVAVALTLGFVALSWWWLATDTRPPTNDAARHLRQAIDDYRFLQAGVVGEPFTVWTDFGYPPLMHLIGAVSMLMAGGIGVLVPTLTLNLIFVPLLALGTYGTAKIAFADSRAGLLAVVFALSVPLLLSQFKVFMIDAPLAAVVALTTWLVLASDRFSHRGYTIAAGAAAGAGLMLKTVFPVYLVGLVAVVLLRGGWRHWRNLALVGVPALAIAAPWALLHFGDLSTKVADHLTASHGATFGGEQFPDRWTLDNFTWYGWSLVSTHLYLPLALFVAAGVGYATVSAVRRGRDRSNYAPELLVGLISSYFFVSLLPLDDHRYLLPALVFMAALGAGWIVKVRPPLLRHVAIAALVAVAAVNVAVQHLGMPGPQARIDFRTTSAEPGIRGEGTFTLASEKGYTFLGVPDRQAQGPQILDAARRAGVDTVSFSVVENPGVPILFRYLNSYIHGRDMVIDQDPYLGPDEVHLTLVPPRTPAPPGEPCTVWEDGTRFLVYRGDSRNLPWDRYRTWCPLD